jgi:hypothetical protein
MNRRHAFILAFLLALATAGHAQQAGIDTAAAPRRAQPDTAAFVMHKSPWGAVLRSALVPGLGQFYNESYWKIPIVLGLTGFLVAGIIQENNSFLDYRDRYAASITPTQLSGNLVLKQFREYYRNNRDTYAWYFLITYLVQCVDAYVDAQLYDFDISDEAHASLRLLPSGRLSFSLSW